MSVEPAERPRTAPSTDGHRERGRRLVLRYAVLQLACAALVAVVVAAVALRANGSAAAAFAGAKAALVGGLVVAVGNVLFGWKLFAPGIAPVSSMTRAWYAGEVLKWLWIGFALWLALGPARLAPLPLLLGLIAAQIGFWIGLAVLK